MSPAETEEFEAGGSKPDVILHPTRLRILNALSPHRQLSRPQIGAVLPDVPQSSLYRHLEVLVEAGVVQALEPTGSRNTKEKEYALSADVLLSPDDFADARPEDLVRYFTTFASLLLSHGRAYYGRKEARRRGDAWYSADALYLTDQEFEQFTAALAGLTALARSLPPAPDRRRRMFYTTILPEEE